jgi:hypothetical protein
LQSARRVVVARVERLAWADQGDAVRGQPPRVWTRGVLLRGGSGERTGGKESFFSRPTVPTGGTGEGAHGFALE